MEKNKASSFLAVYVKLLKKFYRLGSFTGAEIKIDHLCCKVRGKCARRLDAPT